MRRSTLEGDFDYQQSLVTVETLDATGQTKTVWQWSINLHLIIDEKQGHVIYDVLNRPWQRVGPTFQTQDAGAHYLGLDDRENRNARKNADRLIEEYNGLFDDTIQTRQRLHAEREKTFGRPSQGRSIRLQVGVTRELNNWIVRKQKGTESVSETVFRLLEVQRKEEETQPVPQETA